MKKKKIMIFSVVLFILALCLCVMAFLTSKNDGEFSEGNYLVVSSNMLDSNSKLLSLSNDGKIIATKDLKGKDLYFSNYNDDKLILCGQRSSDNFIINKDLKSSRLKLWTKENKTGVSAIDMSNDKLYALMNIGYIDDIYENTFIIQSIDGQMLDEVNVKLVGSGVAVKDNYAVLSGSETHSGTGNWYGKIILYDLDSKEIVKEIILKEYSEITDTLIKDQKLYFVAKKLNVENDSIVETNLSLNEFTTIYEGSTISGLMSKDNNAYFVDNTHLKSIDLNNQRSNGINEKLIDNGYYSNSVLYNDKVLIMMRYNDKDYKKGNVHLGKIIEYDISENNVKVIELKIPKKYNSDTFFVFPNPLSNK